MPVDRHLALPLRRRAAQQLEPVLVEGPRGSGKTTLLRREFPGHRYVALDDAADRAAARKDPAAFLARLRGQPAVIDDLHRAPELAQFLANSEAVSLPLVLASARRLSTGPAARFELHPPTLAERERRPPLPLEMLGRFQPAPRQPPVPASEAWTPPRCFLDHDVRDMVNVHDLDRFESFFRVAEGWSGEVLDQQALALEAGVSHRTAVRWLAVLDDCFLTLRLEASDLAFGRRLVRRPKLHFLQMGRPCFGAEAVSEIYRNARHAGLAPVLRYWRDSNGFEIPLVIEAEGLPPMPVAVGETLTAEAGARLRRWMQLAGVEKAAIITRSPGLPAAATERRESRMLRYAISQL